MFRVKQSSALVFGLVLAFGTACSGGNFLAQNGGNKPSKKKAAAAEASDEGNIYTVEGIMDLPVEQYYVQTFLNIAGTVGDDEFYVEGMAFSDIASLYLGLVEDELNNSDGTLTIGEKIEEAGLDPYLEVEHDEFIAALDTFQSMKTDDSAAALKLTSGYALQSGVGGNYYNSACTANGSGVVSNSGATATNGTVNAGSNCTNYGSVPIPQSYNASAQAAATIPNLKVGQPSQVGVSTKPASCGKQVKTGYTGQVMVDGKCISQVQYQFDQMAASDKSTACKNLEYLGGTFLAHASACAQGSGYTCDPTQDINGTRKDVTSNFRVGTDDQERSIANYGAQEAMRLMSSSCK